MSIDSINATTTSQTYKSKVSDGLSQANESTGDKTAGSQMPKDTISLSDEARRFAVDLSQSVSASGRAVYGQYTGRYSGNGDTSSSSEYVSYGDMMLQSGRSHREYAAEKEAHDKARLEEILSIMENLNAESGGLMHGTAFSDDLSKPITTTSGALHPDAEKIRTFLREHRAELEQLKALDEQSFPSFDEWQVNEG